MVSIPHTVGIALLSTVTLNCVGGLQRKGFSSGDEGEGSSSAGHRETHLWLLLSARAWS